MCMKTRKITIDVPVWLRLWQWIYTIIELTREKSEVSPLLSYEGRVVDEKAAISDVLFEISDEKIKNYEYNWESKTDRHDRNIRQTKHFLHETMRYSLLTRWRVKNILMERTFEQMNFQRLG